MAADRWDEVWGVRAYTKLRNLHHLVYTNDDCEEVTCRANELMKVKLKVIWGLNFFWCAQTFSWCSFCQS